MLAAVGCARRVSQRCHAPTKRTTGAGPQRGWSTLPVPPFPAKSCDDDDVEGRERYRGHGIVAHPTATNNGYGNNVTVREYHASPYRERVGPAAFLALGAVAATAKAGQYAVQGYNEWKAASLAEEQKRKEDGNDAEEEGSASQTGDEKEAGAEKKAGDEKKTGAGGDEKAGRRENLFANLFGAAVGSRYYEGGFEDQMTRREAALILGVRESSAAKRIKEAHRKLLILNHPDTGGSTFLSGKLNEAKELLLKGKRR